MNVLLRKFSIIEKLIIFYPADINISPRMFNKCAASLECINQRFIEINVSCNGAQGEELKIHLLLVIFSVYFEKFIANLNILENVSSNGIQNITDENILNHPMTLAYLKCRERKQSRMNLTLSNDRQLHCPMIFDG